MMKCAVYARVSTEMKSQLDSLENQLTFFENFIREKGWELVKTYADEGKSGTSTVKRVELQKLMKDAEQRKFEIVLIKSVSRWARDTVDSILLVRQLMSFGIRVMSVEDNFDSFDDGAEFKLAIYSALAQQESDTISKRVKFGISVKSREGKFHGSLPPYGYEKVKGKLELHPIHSQTVRHIFDLYLREGWGMQKIANYLTAKKFPTPRAVAGAKNAGDKWQYSSVKLILTNPHYTGDLVQGRSKTDGKDKIFMQKKGYKKRLKNKQDEWIVIPDAHPAIISREEFQEVQEKISKKGEKIFRGRGKKALFARLAFCADCGAGMNYKNDRKGYVCATYQKNGKQKCQSHYIKHSDLKDKVLADLRDLATDSLNMKALLDIALKRAGTKKLEAMEELKRVEREIESLQAEKRELLRLLTRQVITQRDYEEQYQLINNEQTALEQQKRALEDTLSKEVDTETNIHAFQAEIQRFISLQFDNEETLRHVLHRLIDRVEVSADGQITIHYNFKNPIQKGA